MISMTTEQNYYLYPQPMDMRKGIDRLAEVVRTEMLHDPYITNGVYVFMSRDLRKINPNRSLGPISLGDIKVFSCSPESKECLSLVHRPYKT